MEKEYNNSTIEQDITAFENDILATLNLALDNAELGMQGTLTEVIRENVYDAYTPLADTPRRFYMFDELAMQSLGRDFAVTNKFATLDGAEIEIEVAAKWQKEQDATKDGRSLADAVEQGGGQMHNAPARPFMEDVDIEIEKDAEDYLLIAMQDVGI